MVIANEFCGREGFWVQVLGASGSDLAAARGGASYLIWLDGKARILIDAGAGSAVRFAQSRAVFADLDAVLFSNLHPETRADFPVLLRRSYYGTRSLPLAVLGPSGNKWVPSPRQAFAFWQAPDSGEAYSAEALASLPEPVYFRTPFRLHVQEVPGKSSKIHSGFRNSRFSARSIPVDFGNIPAVAWQVSAADVSIVFAGNSSGASGALSRLAKADDMLIMHLGIGEGTRGALRNLYAPPLAIARIATAVQAKALLLGGRMGRTLGLEAQIHKTLEAKYKGPILFANDNDCFGLPAG